MNNLIKPFNKKFGKDLCIGIAAGIFVSVLSIFTAALGHYCHNTLKRPYPKNMEGPIAMSGIVIFLFINFVCPIMFSIIFSNLLVKKKIVNLKLGIAILLILFTAFVCSFSILILLNG